MGRGRAAVCALSAAAALAGCTSDTAQRNPAPSPRPSSASTAPATTATPTPATSSRLPTAATPRSSPARSGPVRPGRATVVASGLAVPWGVAFLPDGSALVSERDSHRIIRVDGSGRMSEAGVVPGVADDTAEGGLLGIVASPSFARDALLYAYLTAPADNRIVRMTYRNGRLGPPELVFAGIPKAVIHNGGRIAFGPDGLLYATTGDATIADRAPDRDYLGGKVLRMTADGDPAPGNPYPRSVVFTRGHRNPQGLAWGPDGSLYEAEFGQNALDEINLLRAGNDYGWPTVEGTVGPRSRAHTPPLLTWDTGEASPSGLAYAGDSLWLATLQGERVYRIRVRGPGRVAEPTALLHGDYGRLRTVAQAPDGSLWVTTSNRDGRGDPGRGDDRIVRVPLTR